MNSISESELADNARAGAVTYIKVLKAEKGGFNLYAQLTWKKGELLLTTQKKQPRNWASVDRMISHINKHYSNISSITLILKGSENETKPPNKD